MSDAVLESVVRRDRIIVTAALTLLVAAAWLYLVHLASTMSAMSIDDMPGMAMAEMYEWGWIEVATLAVMWAVMMVAMMTPAEAPSCGIGVRAVPARSGWACATGSTASVAAGPSWRCCSWRA